MSKVNMISKWLGLFGKSQVFSLNDVNTGASVKKGNFDWGTNHTLESYISVNDENPFGLFFTPNGDLGVHNKIGEKIARSKSHCSVNIYSFFIDIDIKDTEFTSMSKLKDVTLKTIAEEKLPVSYMTESGGGFHLYMFVEESCIGKLRGVNFKKIQEEFAGRFDGGDLSSHSVNKLIRLPFSNHWKTLEAIPLKLYKIYNDGGEIECNEVTHEDEIEYPSSYLPGQYISNMNDNIKEDNNIRVTMSNSQKQKEIDNDTYIINNVNIVKAISILNIKYEKYTRVYLGYIQKFSVDGTRVSIENIDASTGEMTIDDTSGYRINAKENYIYNFSGDKHPIEERPRGNTFSFLYHYFNKDIKKVKEFLENEFGIILKQKDNYGYLNIKTINGVIIFSKEGVFFNKEVKTKNGNDVVQKTLFEVPIEIVGVFSSKYTSFGEADYKHNYYMIRRLDIKEDSDIIVNFNVDRKSFNRTYGSMGLVFFGGEEDMLYFYSALNKASMAGQVKTLDFEYLNGFRKDKIILGDKMYDKDFNIVHDESIILKTQKIELELKGKEECTVREFATKVRSLFTDRVSVLSTVSYITLFLGHDFWKIISTYKQQSLIPGLIISGKTRAGKTTLLSILKEGSGLTIDTRKYSIKSTTAQPLKQAGTDSFILHLEEFTGDIHPDKETIIRDILNKSISARGTITGDNINFVYRSSLILDGERLPVSQSVVNRTVLIPMFESDKTGDEKSLYDIKKYIFLPDLVKKGLSCSEDDKLEAFKKAEDVLLEMGITGRNTMLYSFLLASNYLIKIVDNKILLDTIKENFKLLGEAEVGSDDLSDLLSHIFITSRIRGTLDINRFSMSGDSQLVGSISIDSHILAEKRIDIINIIKKYGGEIKLDGFTLIFDTDIKNPFGSRLISYRQYFN